ncbi:putative invertase inhibitor [Curcuma longa]|uniref:putative invertase inhibitor n=1 Tax=Curcuma longa TaxID=136217 RepID=UPI003D9EA3DB
MAALTHPPLLLLLAAVASLTVAAVSEDPSSPSTLQENCAHTPFPNLCVTHLSLMPESHTADAHNFAELAIRAAASTASKTSAFIDNTLEAAVNDSTWQQCLNDCAESYIDAVEQLDDSTGAMESNKYPDVKRFVAAAVTDVETCQEGCKAAVFPEKTKVAEMNEEVKNLCAVVLDLVGRLPN